MPFNFFIFFDDVTKMFLIKCIYNVKFDLKYIPVCYFIILLHTIPFLQND